MKSKIVLPQNECCRKNSETSTDWDLVVVVHARIQSC